MLAKQRKKRKISQPCHNCHWRDCACAIHYGQQGRDDALFNGAGRWQDISATNASSLQGARMYAV